MREERDFEFSGNSTGSKRREANAGEVQSLFSVSTLAAAFWISWKLFTELLGHPDNKELQKSSIEVTNPWTSFSAII